MSWNHKSIDRNTLIEYCTCKNTYKHGSFEIKILKIQICYKKDNFWVILTTVISFLFYVPYKWNENKQGYNE